MLSADCNQFRSNLAGERERNQERNIWLNVLNALHLNADAY